MANIERVKYGKNPLVEVIYQLRFPTILSINANDPVRFQEEIRAIFPYYRKIVQENEIVVNEVKSSVTKEINHEFVSADKKSKVNLTSSFIAISSLSYDQWEYYREKVKYIRKTFESIYHPSFYSRVGLRYKDVIDRTRFNLRDKGWVDLIQPSILGVINASNQFTLKQWTVNSEYIYEGTDIATKQQLNLAHKVGDNLPVMVFDCDYFKIGNLRLDSIEEISDQLHDKSSTFLRNAITEELHRAMDPQAL